MRMKLESVCIQKSEKKYDVPVISYFIEVMSQRSRMITPTRTQLPPNPRKSVLVGFMISQFDPGKSLSFSNFPGFL